MRHAMIALLLCACAQTTLAKRPSAMRVAVENAIEAVEYQEFYKEFTAGHYDKAKTIVDQKKVNRRKVVEDVLLAMWQEIEQNGTEEAKTISKTFQLDRATELVFAKSAFDSAVGKNLCQNASDVAFLFNLGPAYLDGAINCAVSQYDPDNSFYDLISIATIACEHPGTAELQKKVMASWVEIFEKGNAGYRDYGWMAEIATLCPYTADQYAKLFELGIIEGELSFSLSILQVPLYKALVPDMQPLYRRLYQESFTTTTGVGVLYVLYNWSLVTMKNKPPIKSKLSAAQDMLEDDDFQKTPADYEKFVAATVNQLNCGLAATIALKNSMPDEVVEKVFLNPKCFGGSLSQVSLGLIPAEKAKWFFGLSLQAHEYLLAYSLVKRFNLEDSYFYRIVDEALIAKDYDSIMDLEPPAGVNKQFYQNSILDRIMNLNDEWFIVRYAYSPHSDAGFSHYIDAIGDDWIKRAYEHAIGRNAFALAADIANKRRSLEERKAGTELAFELALKAKSKEAEEIAIRWPNPDRSAWIADKRKKEAEAEEKRLKKREEKRRKIRACKIGDDWCVRQVK